MKHRPLLFLGLALLLLAISVEPDPQRLVRWAEAVCTNTPTLTLCKPAVGDTDVLTRYNENFDKLDAPAKLVVTGAGPHAIGGATSSAATVNIPGGQAVTGTDGASLRIGAASTGASNNYALQVAAGAVSFDGGVRLGGSVGSLAGPSVVNTGSFMQVAAGSAGYTWNNQANSIELLRLTNTGSLELTTARLVQKLTNPTYGTSVAIDASLGNTFRITATNGTAFTVANPTNAATGQKITVMIRNTSGGALGTVTWDTLYKLATWTSPANANSRSISFVYDGTNWVETSRTTTDVPN